MNEFIEVIIKNGNHYGASNFIDPYYYRGVFYYHAGEYQKAADDFDTAVSTSSYRHDKIDNREQPWEIMSDASIKARGKNSYTKVIRDVDNPGDLELSQPISNDDMVNKNNKRRKQRTDRELILMPGKYDVKIPGRDGLVSVGKPQISSTTTSTTITQRYKEIKTTGRVFHSSYDFLPRVVYKVTPQKITIVK
jgi:hypothetical protein